MLSHAPMQRNATLDFSPTARLNGKSDTRRVLRRRALAQMGPSLPRLLARRQRRPRRHDPSGMQRNSRADGLEGVIFHSFIPSHNRKADPLPRALHRAVSPVVCLGSGPAPSLPNQFRHDCVENPILAAWVQPAPLAVRVDLKEECLGSLD